MHHPSAVCSNASRQGSDTTMSVQCPQLECTWPRSIASRACRLSDHPDVALAMLQRRYRSANAHPLTLACISPLAPKLCQNQTQRSVPTRTSAFVLRFHPNLRNVVSRALHIAPPPPELNLTVLSAWKNALPSLNSRVGSTSRASREGRREGSLCVSEPLSDNLTDKPLLTYSTINMCNSKSSTPSVGGSDPERS